MTFAGCNFNMQLVTKNKTQIYGYSFFIQKKKFLGLCMDQQSINQIILHLFGNGKF